MRYDIANKRIYSTPLQSDGARVLVDRLWPRGMRREALALEDWYRDASPSPGLRRAWHRGTIDRATFIHDYRNEIRSDETCLVPLMRLARQGRLTLLSAARDLEGSHLPVLREALLEALYEEDRQTDDAPSSAPCYAGHLDSEI